MEQHLYIASNENNLYYHFIATEENAQEVFNELAKNEELDTENEDWQCFLLDEIDGYKITVVKA